MLKLRVFLLFAFLLSVKGYTQRIYTGDDTLKDRISISINGGLGLPAGAFHSASNQAQMFGYDGGEYAQTGQSYSIALKIPFQNPMFGALFMVGYNSNQFDLNEYLTARANYDYYNEAHISPSSGSNISYNPYNPYYGLNKSNYQLYNGMLGVYLRIRNEKVHVDFKTLIGTSIGQSPDLQFYQNITNVGTSQYEIFSSYAASVAFDLGIQLGYKISKKIDVSIGADFFTTSLTFNTSENVVWSPSAYGGTEKVLMIDCPISLLNIGFGVGYSF